MNQCSVQRFDSFLLARAYHVSIAIVNINYQKLTQQVHQICEKSLKFYGISCVSTSYGQLERKKRRNGSRRGRALLVRTIKTDSFDCFFVCSEMFSCIRRRTMADCQTDASVNLPLPRRCTGARQRVDCRMFYSSPKRLISLTGSYTTVALSAAKRTLSSDASLRRKVATAGVLSGT